MNYALTTLVLINLFNFSAIAVESTGTRGGGNAVICFDTSDIPGHIRERDKNGNFVDPSIRDEYISHITSIELLDVFEAKMRKGFDSTSQVPELILPNDGENTEAYARRVLQRGREFMPYFYQRTLEVMKKMPASAAISHDYGIEFVDDFNMIGRIDSSRCVIGTVAMNLAVSEDLYELHFDTRLLNNPKLSKISRYTTYLHEVVYRAAKSIDEEKNADSSNSRRLVSTLIRKNATLDDLVKVIQGNVFSIQSSIYGDVSLEIFKLFQINDDNMNGYCLVFTTSDKQYCDTDVLGKSPKKVIFDKQSSIVSKYLKDIVALGIADANYYDQVHFGEYRARIFDALTEVSKETAILSRKPTKRAIQAKNIRDSLFGELADVDKNSDQIQKEYENMLTDKFIKYVQDKLEQPILESVQKSLYYSDDEKNFMMSNVKMMVEKRVINGKQIQAHFNDGKYEFGFNKNDVSTIFPTPKREQILKIY